jgi:ribosomal protein S18 acetylase RimI-like enzyme
MRQGDLTTAEREETIRHARSARDIERARELFLEYAQWLKVDLRFQGFDRELASLPGGYAPPRGRLLLAGGPDSAFGCIALRPLGKGARLDLCTSQVAKARDEIEPGPFSAFSDAAIGEVKRLYVQSARRGEGWGELLARAIVAEARASGYRGLKLDTLEWMTAARALYTGLGFRECAPYYENPLAGVVYMSLAL